MDDETVDFWDRPENRDPFPLVESLAFNDVEISGGWMAVTVVCGSFSRCLVSSYLCEPLGGFLSRILELADFLDSQDWDYPITDCNDIIWEGEPWCARWRLRGYEDKTVDVVLEDDSKGKDETLLRVRLDLRVLLEATYEMARYMLTAYGLTRYQAAWMAHDFPLRNFVLLHNRVTGEAVPVESLAQDIQFLSRFISPHAESADEKQNLKS